MNNPYLSFKGLFRNHFSGTLPLLAIVLTVVFGLGIASQSYGQGVPGVQNGADFQTQFDELVKEYDPLLEQWTADYRGAKTRAERSEVLKRKPSGTYGDKLLELYETHADEPGSKAALEKARFKLCWIGLRLQPMTKLRIGIWNMS